MTALVLSAVAPSAVRFTPYAEVSPGCDNENHGDDEVKKLYDFVECGLLVLEKKNQSCSDDTSEPRTEDRRKVAAVEESILDPFFVVLTGMRLRHL